MDILKSDSYKHLIENRKILKKRFFIFLFLTGILLILITKLFSFHDNRTIENEDISIISNKISEIEATEAIPTDDFSLTSPNQRKLQVISSENNQLAKLSDNSTGLEINISDIPNCQRVFGCSSFIEYRSDDGNIIINYYINKGMSEYGIEESVKKYANNADYNNELLNIWNFKQEDFEEIPENLFDSGMVIHYKNHEKLNTEIIFNKKINDTTSFTLEIIQKNDEQSEEINIKDYIYLLQEPVMKNNSF